MSKFISPPPEVEWNDVATQQWVEGLCRRVGVVNQEDSTASDVATLKADFNSLLAKLQANGFMEK